MSNKWCICTLCEGDGKVANPNIDSHGLSQEDFDEDPDFEEAYRSGAYDVTCRRCNGTGKLLRANLDQIHEDANRRAEERRLSALEDGDFEGFISAYDPRW